LRHKSLHRSCRFWGPNQKTLHLDFEAQLINRRHRFWGQTRETVVTDFEVKPEKTVPMILRSNHWQTVIVVLRPNHSQTVDLGFEAQSRNSCSLSLRAQCRPHTASSDRLIVRPLSTRPVRPSLILCTRSPSTVTILITVCHAALATCTPWDKQTRFSTWYKR
jgi:hypothetical protein